MPGIFPHVDGTNMNDPASPTPPRRLWLLLPSVAVSLTVALIPWVGLLSQKVPPWYAAGAALALGLVLPLAWHYWVEAGTGRSGGASKLRLSLRILAMAGLILGVSLCELGPRGVYRNLGVVFGRFTFLTAGRGTPSPTGSVSDAGTTVRPGLDGLIPADATLAVGLSGSAAMRQLLSAHGLDSREKLDAFATCKIDIENAQVLVAKRLDGAQLVVVRAQGIGDERNLYCLVGVVGSNRLQIQIEGTGSAKTFLVQGLLPRPLLFRPLDATTVAATDAVWLPTADRKIFVDGSASPAPLAIPLRRVDRTAPVWSAGIVDSPSGIWDLAVDARLDGNHYRLHATSVPPWGDGDQAEFDGKMPLTFASALPEGALSVGVQGVVSALGATGLAMRPPSIRVAPLPDAGTR